MNSDDFNPPLSLHEMKRLLNEVIANLEADREGSIEPSDQIQRQKVCIRGAFRLRRKLQAERVETSLAVLERCFSLPEFQSAQTVMMYVGVRDEVRTRDHVERALEIGKRVVVPYCVDDDLRLFILKSLNELVRGRFGIPEPTTELRHRDERQIQVDAVDLIVVPGVVFDAHGGRLGNGKGYYDRLLAHARHDCPLVGVAFDCQLFEEIPMLDHDIYLDKVVTESTIYKGKGRVGAGTDSPTSRK